MFSKSREENARNAEAEKKKIVKEASKERSNTATKRDWVYTSFGLPEFENIWLLLQTEPEEMLCKVNQFHLITKLKLLSSKARSLLRLFMKAVKCFKPFM